MVTNVDIINILLAGGRHASSRLSKPIGSEIRKPHPAFELREI